VLRADNLKFRRGAEVLFDHLSFVVHPGQRVAVAGRNGVGKSTLFDMLLGKLHADAGDLTLPADWSIGYMEQETVITQRPSLAFVVDGDARVRDIEQRLHHTTDPENLARLHADYQDVGGYEAEARAGEILHGLGFTSTDFDKPYAAFSGGWRIRLNLAQALMTPCELLLLDEPTNHLDLEAIMWLEGWLTRFPGTVMVIAHDRAFLDACTDQTIYLSNQSGRLYNGNYSSCERQRAEHLEQQAAIRAKRDAQAAHIQKFVDRFRAKASKAKQVQSRIKALERLQDSAVIALDSPYTVNFQPPDRVSNPLFTLRGVGLGYGDSLVLRDLNLSILPGARIGVLGANGAGKSTLLKALVGELQPMGGELSRGQHCEIGYFAQHQLETLNAEQAALKLMLNTRPQWREQQCRDHLGRWGFDAAMITRPIATLSGGEKARLVLALIALDKPAVLVLDEPTNHLDLDMRDALAFALQDYPGAVVIVSHDRVLLEKTVDEFWVLEDGSLTTFNGDLQDYATAKKAVFNAPSPAKPSAGSRKANRQDRARQRASIKHLRDTAKRLERDMEQQAQELAELEKQLADSDVYNSTPTQQLDTLLARSGKLRATLTKTEEDWLSACAALEDAG